MTNQKKRGRPATGRKRDKQVKFNLSEVEFNKLKEISAKENKTITALVIDNIINK